MSADPSAMMSPKRAREVLGVTAATPQTELRRAFREAAKRAHPDRKGGDAVRFREVVEAYHLLQGTTAARTSERIVQPPASAPRRAAPAGDTILPVTPMTAMAGGEVEHDLADGRRLRIALPAGLRTGDKVRADGATYEVAVRGDGQVMVRGDDVWISVALDPRLLAEGGRIGLETPLGRRVVWITKKAGERGLIRLIGQGLPARGRHRQGHLFLRLTAQKRTTDTAAQTLRRRFAAAWAA